ncbi:MAG: ribonuclease H-like domain-containing protein [Planctomycetota bacterium]
MHDQPGGDVEACRSPMPEEVARRVAAFDARRRFLVGAINDIPGLSTQTPTGAFYVLVDVRQLCAARGVDDVGLCERLLDRPHRRGAGQRVRDPRPPAAQLRCGHGPAREGGAPAPRLRGGTVNHDEQKLQLPIAANLAALEVDRDCIVFAQLRAVREFATKDNRPFLVLELADVHAVLEGKVWDDAKEAMAAAREAATPCTVKVLGKLQEWNGKQQFVVKRLKPLVDGESPDGYDPDQLFDPALRLVEDLCCKTLVFDIETVPAFDRRELPPAIAEALASYTARKAEPDVVDAESKKFMGMSPFYGKIVSLAVGDGDAEPGSDDVTALAVPPEGFALDECPKWLRLMSEADLLRAFWALCSRAETVVTFNGRGFDVPFVVGRSLIHGIPARVDLMSQRFALRPHLDLFELLSQRNRGPSKLDVVCWALGIESPKGEMDGSMVAPAYARGEIVEIAQYNVHDVRATAAVYRKVRDLVLRYRADWTAAKG